MISRDCGRCTGYLDVEEDEPAQGCEMQILESGFSPSRNTLFPLPVVVSAVPVVQDFENFYTPLPFAVGDDVSRPNGMSVSESKPIFPSVVNGYSS